ncbi:MAG: GDSL-type esterase/lipase family protein [Chitinophagales bacterium]
MRQIISLFGFLFISISFAYAQNLPFAGEIQNFRKQDSLHFPPSGAILFVGSSSFTKWKDVQDYFPGYPIINRGFGGSSFPDLIRYADVIIFPYHPRQVIIYCGDNDINSSDTVDAISVFNRFLTLFGMIRKQMPEVSIVFVSIKPSPSRAAQRPRQIAANKLIRDFLSTHANASYVNVADLMLNKDGRPIPSIFLSDSLHMNASGYAIWQKAILPYLKK